MGAKQDNYSIVRRHAASGGAAILYCTEVPEVFALADGSSGLGRAHRPGASSRT